MPWHELLINAALLTLSVAALAFAAVGLLLSLRPSIAPDAEPADRPARGLLGMLETPRHVERFIYRHHSFFGAVIMLGTGFYFWRVAGTDLLWSHGDYGLQAPLLWLLTIGSTFAFVLGAVMLVRPSRLKPLEALANRWVGPESGTVREWISRHPRVQGILILAVSLYGLLVFGFLLAERTAGW